jgi:hypothetical protein
MGLWLRSQRQIFNSVRRASDLVQTPIAEETQHSDTAFCPSAPNSAWLTSAGSAAASALTGPRPTSRPHPARHQHADSTNLLIQRSLPIQAVPVASPPSRPSRIRRIHSTVLLIRSSVPGKKSRQPAPPAPTHHPSPTRHPTPGSVTHSLINKPVDFQTREHPPVTALTAIPPQPAPTYPQTPIRPTGRILHFLGRE